MIDDDKIWAFRALARHALRFGRTFVVFLACALFALGIAGSVCSCLEHEHGGPDAAPGSECFCHRDGHCVANKCVTWDAATSDAGSATPDGAP